MFKKINPNNTSQNDSFLINELYKENDRSIIQNFYEEDPFIRNSLQQAIGNTLTQTNNKTVLTSNSVDMLYLMCSTASFAESEDECQRVALTIYQFYNKPKNVIPCLLFDRGLTFSSKALISLSFFYEHLKVRVERKGSPTPEFYRKVSKEIYTQHKQKDIANHHEQWELFLRDKINHCNLQKT